MLELLSHNRLVALGLVLIGVSAITAYAGSDSDAVQGDDVTAGVISEPAAPPAPDQPSTGFDEFNDGELLDEEALIDDAAGLDPNPEGGSDTGPSPSSDGQGPRVVGNSGSADEGDVSIIVDNDQIEYN